MDDEILVEDELLVVDELIDELELTELALVDELREELELIDDGVELSLLITLVDDVEVESTSEVVDSVLDETTGSEEMLEVTLVAEPEQAEINRANRSDKCFFIFMRLYT